MASTIQEDQASVSTSAENAARVEPRANQTRELHLTGARSGYARLQVGGPSSPEFRGLAAVLFLLAGAGYAAVRLWRLETYGLFGDEVFTFWVADQGFGNVITSVASDVVHPPLFYLALKCWIALGGSSILWLKLLPVLFSFAVIPPLVLLCRELRMPAAAINLTLGLIACNAFLVGYSQELRMYSLLMTLTVTSLWLFVKLVNRDTRAVGLQFSLMAVNLLLVFTHYYGWLIVGLELLFVLIWRRERTRGFAVAVVAILCAFSPWAYVVAREARNKPARVNFVWNAPPALSDLAGYYANLNGALSYRWKIFGTVLMMMVFAAPITAWGATALRPGARDKRPRGESVTFCWFAVFAFAPAAISFCASHLFSQSVWAPRYLIIAAPVYLMLVAAAVFKLPGTRVSSTAAVVLLGWAIVSGVTDLTNRDKIAWEPLVAEMLRTESNGLNGLKVFTIDPNLGNTIQFSLDRLSKERCEAVYVEGLGDLQGDHFWVAHIRYKHETGPLPREIMRDSGYEVGVGFEAGAANHEGFLFPVWKPGPRAARLQTR